jgi:hypothetical protein
VGTTRSENPDQHLESGEHLAPSLRPHPQHGRHPQRALLCPALLAARCSVSVFASPLASRAPLAPRRSARFLTARPAPDPRADVAAQSTSARDSHCAAPCNPVPATTERFLSTLQLFTVSACDLGRPVRDTPAALAAHPQRASTAAHRRCQLRARPHETNSATTWLRVPSRRPLASCINCPSTP